MALRMATGWEPDDADVVIGTSGGAFAAAMVRGGRLDLEPLIGDSHHRHEVAERLRGYLFRRSVPRGVARWVRRGVLPSLRRPNLNVVLGSPGMYHTAGLGDWIDEVLGPAAETWPVKPTVIVAYDIQSKQRTPFGTEAAPDVSLRDAVRASAAVPFVFEPVRLDGRWYADGGLGSGTSADLLLANPTPLDLVIIIAPLASTHVRDEARFYEETLDRIGREALDAELTLIEETWPETEVLVLRPTPEVLAAARPNPLSTEAALPTFLRDASRATGSPGVRGDLERAAPAPGGTGASTMSSDGGEPADPPPHPPRGTVRAAGRRRRPKSMSADDMSCSISSPTTASGTMVTSTASRGSGRDMSSVTAASRGKVSSARALIAASASRRRLRIVVARLRSFSYSAWAARIRSSASRRLASNSASASRRAR